MNTDEKKQIVQRLTSRVSTGLHFIELEYLNNHKQPDPAFIRNIYILLSFYAELLLKAVYVMVADFDDKNDLDQKLRGVGHNLSLLGEKIGQKKLEEYKIKDIIFKNKEYLVKTTEEDFYVKDFTDIRYDFLEGKVRTLKGDEHEMFKNQINIMREINKILQSEVW